MLQKNKLSNLKSCLKIDIERANQFLKTEITKLKKEIKSEAYTMERHIKSEDVRDSDLWETLKVFLSDCSFPNYPSIVDALSKNSVVISIQKF